MCDKKPCDNCCHEEDLLCCMPLRHCCGGYSEHNNCCPHDRCCNHPCGGCDCCDGCGGCPFGPEPCCCKAMKCCKKCKEELEKLSEKTADDIGKLNSDVEENSERITEVDDRLTELLGNLAEKEQNDVDDLQSQINAEVERATVTEQQLADDLAAEVERATGRENQIEAKSIVDVEYDSVRKEMVFITADPQLADIRIGVEDFVKDGMLSSVTLITLLSGNKGLEFVFNTDSGKETITVDIGDWFDESNYWNINTTTQKLSELEDKVTKQLSWSGLSTGSYNGEAAASFMIPNGSVTANTGSVLNSVSINNSTGQLSGTTVPLPVVPTDISAFNNDMDYQTGSEVSNAIDTAIEGLGSGYDATAHKAVHFVGITDGKLDNRCSSIAIPYGSVNATTGQALSGFTIDQNTGVITGTSIAIPNALVQSDWNQSNSSAVDFIKNKPTIPAAQLQSDWNASSGVTAIANKPTIVKKVRVGSGGTEYTTDVNGVIEIPAYPNVSTTNITIDGTTQSILNWLTDIVNRIEALEEDSLWELNSTTGYVTTKNSKSAAANKFYDTSVS